MGKLKERLNYMIYGGIAIGVTSLEWLMLVIAVLALSTGTAFMAYVMLMIGSAVLAAVNIYLSYIRCEMIYNLNMACGLKENGDASERSMNYVLVDLLTRITAGIYGLYWIYKQEQRMGQAGRKYGLANRMKTRNKNYYYMIVAGTVCSILSIVLILLCFSTLMDVLEGSATQYVYSIFGGSYYTPSFTGTKACVIFGAIFAIAGVVLSVFGRNPLYYDVNIMSAAFNRETNNGNQIMCVGRPGSGPDSRIQPAGTGGVKMLSGQYAGSVIQMQNKERITIGRDKTQCDLVCNSDRVSRVHLSITYFVSGMSGPEYIVRDMSSNGTSSSTIGQLPKNQEVRQRPGTVLTLGNSAESIQLL
ncbi:MAG: DUF4234 domain-containing protein [Clostridiales bacterium]|nr:DUF4234 domain-containing protein [Clostridiales bacterium]